MPTSQNPDTGAPSRRRGGPGVHRGEPAAARNTPAAAGRTAPACPASAPTTEHPRFGGEDILTRIRFELGDGTPPRWRGGQQRMELTANYYGAPPRRRGGRPRG